MKKEALQIDERLAPSMKASLAVAQNIIMHKIDSEGKYVADALYEFTGDQLRQYLAFAYRKGLTKSSAR